MSTIELIGILFGFTWATYWGWYFGRKHGKKVAMDGARLAIEEIEGRHRDTIRKMYAIFDQRCTTPNQDITAQNQREADAIVQDEVRQYNIDKGRR